MKKHCKYCDSEFEYLGGKGNYKDYCSRSCAYKAKKERESKKGKKTYKICEQCKKEYIYTFGQANWTKNGIGNGKGTVRSDRFCCYECGIKNHRNKIDNTNLNKYGTKCSLNVPEIKEKAINTIKEKYGVDNAFKSKEIWKKIKQNNIEKYGVENPFQDTKIKEKIKQTNLIRYGKKHPNTFGSKEFKQHMLEKYGTEDPASLPKFREKAYNTKKKNNTFNTSKEEKDILNILSQKFSLVYHEYKSIEYPFPCDFYIPELNLYIEYQGTWLHGEEPFDNNNENHLKIIEQWKQKANEIDFKNESKSMYLHAIEVWTKSDVKKRNWAKENNLNWIEFFNLEQFMEWLKQYK